MIITLNNPEFRSKVLFLDYDWTLVIPKSGGIFPRNVDDWKWLDDVIPSVVKKYYENGYNIVVVTNQKKDWKRYQIETAIASWQIPVTICMAYAVDEFKPSISMMYQAFTMEQLAKINKDESLMVGDALGRVGDHDICDRGFAENMGVKFTSPEEFFELKERVKVIYDGKVKVSQQQEIVIMMGYPGSGKTVLVEDVFGTDENYDIMQGNDINRMQMSLENKRSIVIDARNPSMVERKEYVDLAKNCNVACRCIYLSMSKDECYKRKGKDVSDESFVAYEGKFEYPAEVEGFKLIIV